MRSQSSVYYCKPTSRCTLKSASTEGLTKVARLHNMFALFCLRNSGAYKFLAHMCLYVHVCTCHVYGAECIRVYTCTCVYTCTYTCVHSKLVSAVFPSSTHMEFN